MANSFEVTPATGDSVPSTEIDIAAAALMPKRTRTEEGTVEERSIQELLAAQQATVVAPETPPWGIRLARVRYGSTTPGVRGTAQRFPG